MAKDVFRHAALTMLPPTPVPEVHFPAVTYEQVRLTSCRDALVRAILQRAGYVLAALVVLGAAGSSSLAAIAGLAAWTVLPLFSAARASIIEGVLCSGGYGVAGCAVVWGVSPWLAPRAWFEAERALPISGAQRHRADATLAAIALVPLIVVYVAGTSVWLVKRPAWFSEVQFSAMLLLACSVALSAVLGTFVLHRRHLRATSGRALSSRLNARAHSFTRSLSAAAALVVLPMIRGPARRSGGAFLMSSAGLVLPAGGIVLWPAQSSWWLAAFTVSGQVFLARLCTLVAAELVPLHLACVALPVSNFGLRVSRIAAVMTPLVATQLILVLAVMLAKIPMHPGMLAAFAVMNVLGNLALVASTRSEGGAAARASWSLVLLATCLALASEVVVR